MKPNNSWRTRLGQILLGLGIVIALVVVRGAKAGNEPVHLTTDWSHRHVVFSAPHNLGQHVKLLSNPRYVQQLVRRNSGNHGDPGGWRWHRAPEHANPIQGDWSINMGAGATVGALNFPAKYSFDPTSANCAELNGTILPSPDFVVYNTGLTGSDTQPTIAAFTNLYTGTCSTVTIDTPNTYWVYNTGTGGRVVTSPVLSGDGSQVAFVQNSATAAPTRVQGIGCEALASSVTCILGSSVTPGDLLVWAGSAAFGGGAAAVTASDNCGGTYTVVDTGNAGGGSTNLGTAQGYSTGSHGSCTVTFTATNAPNAITGVVEEITPGILDVHSIELGQSVTGGGTLATTPVTTTATDYAFSFAVDAAGNGGSPTVASPFTVQDSDSPFGISDADFTQSGAGAVTATWTMISPTTAAGAGMMTFEGTGAASLVILRWQAFDSAFTSVGAPTPESPANYNNGSGTTCTAPCQVAIPFDTATTVGCTTSGMDSHSSPFYDYAHDTLYVGNDQGCLHKFSPVFNGAPAEITATGTDQWPALVNSGSVLTSPVFDDGTGRVFVGSATATLYRVDSTIGSGATGVVASGSLGSAGIDDSPVLDSTTGNVYVFVRGDGGGGAAKRAGVYQFTTSFAATTTGNEVQVSSDSTLPVTAFYAGDFDNNYYNSGTGTGNMYVCGTNAGLPTIWRIPVTAGVLGAPVAGPMLTTANAACSGITEFNNGATDRMFLSVTGSAITGTSGGGAVIGCPAPSGGCIMSFDITTTTGWGVATGTSATAAAASGTSGIVVDNSSSASGASQIYFTPLADQPCTTTGDTGGCAIQASQSGLD
jgi:hypothetical protein